MLVCTADFCNVIALRIDLGLSLSVLVLYFSLLLEGVFKIALADGHLILLEDLLLPVLGLIPMHFSNDRFIYL